MHDLTESEIAAIKAEIERQGNIDGAIKFCLGHDRSNYWNHEGQATFEAVKRQVLDSV
jgi:hypothetical protein